MSAGSTLVKSSGGSKSITDTITVVTGGLVPNLSQSHELSIINDGADPVFVRKNDTTVVDADDVEIRIGEVYNFPNAASFAIKCATGKTATIRYGFI